MVTLGPGLRRVPVSVLALRIGEATGEVDACFESWKSCPGVQPTNGVRASHSTLERSEESKDSTV